jgi:NhaA family Na+:H+ antiporter
VGGRVAPCWLTQHEAGVHATIAGAALGILTPAGTHEDTDEANTLTAIEDALHPWVSYFIIPLFALANAGVELGGGAIGDAVSSQVTLGVVLGLAIGKPLGIALAAWLAVRLGMASLPRGVGWAQIAGVGMIAGVGFTVSIFIAGLAFDAAALVDEAKIGILAGSAAMGGLGVAVLRFVGREDDGVAETAAEGEAGFS